MNAGVGLSVVDQAPLSPAAVVSVDDRPPTELWAALARVPAVQAAMVSSIRERARGQFADEFRDSLLEQEQDLPVGIAELAVRIAKGDTNALLRFRHTVERLGTGRSSVADIHAVLGLLTDYDGDGGDDSDTENGDGAGPPPVIEIRLSQSLFEQRPEQRAAVCELISGLAGAFDLRATGGRVAWAQLKQAHRADLPQFRIRCNTSRSELPSPAAVIATLGIDSPATRLLERLGDEPTDTLAHRQIGMQAADVGIDHFRELERSVDQLRGELRAYDSSTTATSASVTEPRPDSGQPRGRAQMPASVPLPEPPDEGDLDLDSSGASTPGSEGVLEPTPEPAHDPDADSDRDQEQPVINDGTSP